MSWKLGLNLLGLLALVGCGSGGSGLGDDGVAGGAGRGDGGPGGPDANLPERPEPGSCQLDDPAFCDEFETPKPGGRGGDLDENLWGVARWGIGPAHNLVFARPLATPDSSSPEIPVFCGSPSFDPIGFDGDIRFCDGEDSQGILSRQLNEIMHDTGDNIAVNSMMIRQPFDFSDGGTIAYDVDAKVVPRGDLHGWWLEVWVSKEPVPVPYQENLASVDSLAPNSIGVAFEGRPTNGGRCQNTDRVNGVTRIMITEDYEFREPYFDEYGDQHDCFGFEDGVLNHFEIRLSTTSIEVWASNPGDPASFKRIAATDDFELDFDIGFVSFQHIQYNAAKAPASSTPTQVYHWDNIGFDGPSLPVIRAAEVPNSQGSNGGWHTFGFMVGEGIAEMEVEIPSLDPDAQPHLNFNTWPHWDAEYRLNGGPWHRIDNTYPSLDGGKLRSMTAPIDVGELRTGANTIEIRNAGPGANSDHVANVDITFH